MNIIVTIFTVILLWYLLNWFIKSPSFQLRISSEGFDRVPILLLKLAKIHKEGDVKWNDLSTAERERMMPYFQKFMNASSLRLTFLYNQNLIHVQEDTRSWFFPMDKGLTDIIREEIGRIDKGIYVEFVVHRRTGGWLRTPVIIGYLRKQRDIGLLENEENEMEILFEFPEAIIHGNFFNKRYISKYDLKEFTDLSYGKNDFGNDEGFSIRTYDQRYKNGSRFYFQVEP